MAFKVFLVLCALCVSLSQASRGFMVLEENRQMRDSPSVSVSASLAQDPARMLYQLFSGMSSAASSSPQMVRQMLPQPVQAMLERPSFATMGNQMDALMSSGYDQVQRRLQQVQSAMPSSANFADGERLLLQMYDMLMNPEEMCRQLAQQAVNPAMKYAMEQGQSAVQATQSSVSSMPSAASSASSAALEPVSSFMNRFPSMGKK